MPPFYKPRPTDHNQPVGPHIRTAKLFPKPPRADFSKRDIISDLRVDPSCPIFDRDTALKMFFLWSIVIIAGSFSPDQGKTNTEDNTGNGFQIGSGDQANEAVIRMYNDLFRMDPRFAAFFPNIVSLLLPEQPEPNPISYHPAVNKVITQLGFRSVIALQVTYSNMTPGKRLATRQRFASLLKTAADEGSITSEDLCQLTNSDGTLYPIKDQIRLFLAEIFGVQIKVESELLPAAVIQNANGMLTLTVTDPESNKAIKTFTIRGNRLFDADGTVACKGDYFVISLPNYVLQALADGQEIDINRLVTEGDIFGLSSDLNNNTLETDATNNYSNVSIASENGGYIILCNQNKTVSKVQLIRLLYQIADYYKIEYTEETSVIELLNIIQQKLVEARAIPEEQQH